LGKESFSTGSSFGTSIGSPEIHFPLVVSTSDHLLAGFGTLRNGSINIGILRERPVLHGFCKISLFERGIGVGDYRWMIPLTL